MKRQLKTPFQTNFKRAVIQVNKFQVNSEQQLFEAYLPNKLLSEEEKDIPESEIDFNNIIEREYNNFMT